MAETETLLTSDESGAELRREQDRLAKLWQAFKSQEDELAQLRRERPVLAETVAEQDMVITRLKEAASYKDRHEEAARQNRVLLLEVEGLNRDLRGANQAAAEHDAELRKEQERLAKLFKVYEEQQEELKAAQTRLAKWESWFTRMEPAIVALPKFFADAPRA